LPAFVASQVFMAMFLFQSFIMLHEYAHQSMFTSSALNTFFGSVSGFFTFIPYYNWKAIHKLHHRWTGWRDKDPTQEKVFIHLLKPKQIRTVDFCWKFVVPIFGFGYRFGTYWTVDKLKRHLNESEFKTAKMALVIHIILYLVTLILFPKLVVFFIPAAVISFMVTDQITLSQHSHIAANLSQGENVSPIPVKEQTKYTRSVVLNKFIAKYFFYHINLHKEHHAYPQMPCYYLDKVKLEDRTHSPDVSSWIKRSRSMKGSQLIFNSHPDCDF